MTDYDAMKEAPFAFLDWFTHWGALPWQKFLDLGVGMYLGKDLDGKKVLEIDPGSGRISCLFALLGAEVTGLELKDRDLTTAGENARRFGVSDKIGIRYYDGDLSVLGDQTFDIIFTKSTLIYPPDLKQFLIGLHDHLDSDGKFVFIENGKGNMFVKIGRLLKRKSFSFFKRTHFFTEAEVDLIKSIFTVELLMRSKMPPIYLICGKKK